MEVKGNVTIGTYNENPITVVTQNNTQNTTQMNIQQQAEPEPMSEDCGSAKQNFASSVSGNLYFEGNKTDFARVINAGILKHCFRHKDGTIATQEEVFTVFAEAFNVDFTYYSRLLNHTRGLDESTNGKVFDSLKDLYIKYASGEVGLQ